MLITGSTDERISEIKKKKRELLVRVIGSKLEIANIVHRKCVFLLNNIFDARNSNVLLRVMKLHG
jgi:hypothetical protein